jgi:hypothetical protein
MRGSAGAVDLLWDGFGGFYAAMGMAGILLMRGGAIAVDLLWDGF